MLFRHFLALPPASDMSAPRLLTAAPSLRAASGLGSVTADARHPGASSTALPTRRGKAEKGNNESITPQIHECSCPGKGGCPSNKRSRSCRGGGGRATNPHLRGGDDAASRTEPPSRSGLLPGFTLPSICRRYPATYGRCLLRETSAPRESSAQPGGEPDSRLPASPPPPRGCSRPMLADWVTLASLNDPRRRPRRCLARLRTDASRRHHTLVPAPKQLAPHHYSITPLFFCVFSGKWTHWGAANIDVSSVRVCARAACPFPAEERWTDTREGKLTVRPSPAVSYGRDSMRSWGGGGWGGSVRPPAGLREDRMRAGTEKSALTM